MLTPHRAAILDIGNNPLRHHFAIGGAIVADISRVPERPWPIVPSRHRR
jgi:hypothetical protein